MHEPGADCKDLIEKTAAALSSEELQQLFLSTQQNNLEICIQYGIKRHGKVFSWIYMIDMICRIVNAKESSLLQYFKKNGGNWACLMALVLAYFPQLVVCIC